MQLLPLPCSVHTIAPVPAVPSEPAPGGFGVLLAEAIGGAAAEGTSPAPGPDPEAEPPSEVTAPAAPLVEMMGDPLVPETRSAERGAPPPAPDQASLPEDTPPATPLAPPVLAPPPLPSQTAASSVLTHPEPTMERVGAIGLVMDGVPGGTRITPSSVAATSVPPPSATPAVADDTAGGGSAPAAASPSSATAGATLATIAVPSGPAPPPGSSPAALAATARDGMRLERAADATPGDSATGDAATRTQTALRPMTIPATSSAAGLAGATGQAASASQPDQASAPPKAAASAVAGTVIRTVEPRGLRVAAPSQQPPIAAAAAATLHATAGEIDAIAEETARQPGPAAVPAPPAPDRATPPLYPPLGPTAAERGAPAERAPPGPARPESIPPSPRAGGETQGQPTGVPSPGATGQTSPGVAVAPGPASSAPPIPAATHALRRLPSVPVAHQITPVIVTLAAAQPGAPGRVTVTLDPVELGRIEVTVRSDRDAHARIHVVAERPETLLLLLRDQASLDRALAQAGVGAEGRTLSFDLAGGGNGRGEDARPSRDDAGRPAAARPGPGAGSPDTIGETPRRRGALGVLDIAV